MPCFRRLCAFVCLFVVVGCSERDSFPELQPLTGTVIHDGKPVTGGGLLFTPDPPDRSALVIHAGVQRDGTFAAETIRTGDQGSVTRSGAPAGRYTITYHPPSDGQKTDLHVRLDQRVTVETKQNAIEIVLPHEMPKGKGMPRDDAPPAAKPGTEGKSKTEE